MKRLAALLLSTILIFSLVGCNNNTNADKDSDKGNVTTYTLNLPEANADKDSDKGNATTYTLNLPAAEDVVSISLSAGTIETAENIKGMLDKIKGTDRTTTTAGIQDAPSVADYTKIDLQLADKTSTVFVYADGGKFYIEQAYNGIYEITETEYNDIIGYYDSLKEEVPEIRVTTLQKKFGRVAAFDWYGKSFKPADLTNDEMLLYGFLQFNPKGSGFTDITFETLNRTYIKSKLGREDVTPKDILCSCGKVIATYNSANDTFTWDDEFHYQDHKAEAYCEIKDMYKIEDRYVVEAYKVFPDLMMNSSTTQFNFYATYSDAAEQKNVLFTVANESEFTSAVEALDDSKKGLYRITLADNADTLINYEIISNGK